MHINLLILKEIYHYVRKGFSAELSLYRCTLLLIELFDENLKSHDISSLRYNEKNIVYIEIHFALRVPKFQRTINSSKRDKIVWKLLYI